MTVNSLAVRASSVLNAEFAQASRIPNRSRSDPSPWIRRDDRVLRTSPPLFLRVPGFAQEHPGVWICTPLDARDERAAFDERWPRDPDRELYDIGSDAAGQPNPRRIAARGPDRLTRLLREQVIEDRHSVARSGRNRSRRSRRASRAWQFSVIWAWRRARRLARADFPIPIGRTCSPSSSPERGQAGLWWLAGLLLRLLAALDVLSHQLLTRAVMLLGVDVPRSASSARSLSWPDCSPRRGGEGSAWGNLFSLDIEKRAAQELGPGEPPVKQWSARPITGQG